MGEKYCALRKIVNRRYVCGSDKTHTCPYDGITLPEGDYPLCQDLTSFNLRLKGEKRVVQDSAIEKKCDPLHGK